MDESQLLPWKGLFSGFSRLDADNHLLAEFEYLNLKLIMLVVRVHPKMIF